jgi:hypothetical protein
MKRKNNEPSYPLYCVILKAVRTDKRLTANAKLLYGDIATLRGQDGYCNKTNAYFAELSGCTVRRVLIWLNQLIECGYVRREIIKDEGTGEVLERRLYCIDSEV